jgi:hypothetical protein
MIICSADDAFLRARRDEIGTYGAEIIGKLFDLVHLVATVSWLFAALIPSFSPQPEWYRWCQRRYRLRIFLSATNIAPRLSAPRGRFW